MRLCCIYFGHSSLSLPQTGLLFRHGVLLPTCLPGLEKPQELCRIDSNAVLSLLLTATGANKTTPLHVGTSYTHDFGFYSKGNVSATDQIVWAESLNPQISWAVRGLHPLSSPINRGTPPLNFPMYSLFRAKSV